MRKLDVYWTVIIKTVTLFGSIKEYLYICKRNGGYCNVYFMKTTSEYLQLLKDYKAMKAMQYGISSIGIFGSVARGEHTEGSDVDICVDLKTPSLFYMVHIKEELQQLFGNPVDIIRIRPEMDALLKRDIMREGIYA